MKNNNDDVNTLCNASTAQGTNRAKENTTKSPSRTQRDVGCVLFVKSPIKPGAHPVRKIFKVCCFFAKKGNFNQKRTDLSLVCDLHNGEFVFGLDLRNSSRRIT